MTTVYTSLTDPKDPRTYWNSEYAQELVNQLPYHSKIRRDASSTGWNLVDQLAGTHMEDLQVILERSLRDSFLTTLSLDTANRYWYKQLDGTWLMNAPSNSRNLLLNSSFDIQSDHSWFADEWDWNTEGSVTRIDGHNSGTALRLTPDGDDPTVAQYVEEFFTAGDTVSLSFFYKSSANSGRVWMDLHHADETTSTVEYTIQDSSSRWVKERISTTATKRVMAITVYARAFNSVVDYDSFMLQRDDQDRTWVPNLEDNYRWITLNNRTPVFIYRPRFIQYTGEVGEPLGEYQWWYANPTRTALDSTIEDDGAGVDTKFVTGLSTDFWGNSWNMGVKKSGDNIQLENLDAGDVHVVYSLRFQSLDNRYIEDTYSLEAITVFRDKVWVVLTKNDWAGSSKRYLGVCDIKTPRSVTNNSADSYSDYLEVQTLLELDSNIPPIRSIYFLREWPDVLFMADGININVVRLYYDYMTIDRRTNEAFFREDYDNLVVNNQNNRRGVNG